MPPRLTRLSFLADGQRGWVVGNNGTILTTTDVGTNWKPQTSGTNANLIGVQFTADGQRGWVVGNNGTILTTTDVGTNWRPQTSGTNADLWGVQFTADGQRGWVVGNNGTILRGERPEQKESAAAVDEGKRKIDAAKLDIQRFEKEIQRIYPDTGQNDHNWMEFVFVQVQASRIGVIVVILFFVNIILNVYRSYA